MHLHPPKKADVIIALLSMARQPSKKNQGTWTRWFFIVRDTAREVQLEIRSDGKTVVDWISGKAWWELPCEESKNYYGASGARRSIFEGGCTIGLCTSFVSTTKQPMRGLKRDREV